MLRIGLREAANSGDMPHLSPNQDNLLGAIFNKAVEVSDVEILAAKCRSGSKCRPPRKRRKLNGACNITTSPSVATIGRSTLAKSPKPSSASLDKAIPSIQPPLATTHPVPTTQPDAVSPQLTPTYTLSGTSETSNQGQQGIPSVSRHDTDMSLEVTELWQQTDQFTGVGPIDPEFDWDLYLSLPVTGDINQEWALE